MKPRFGAKANDHLATTTFPSSPLFFRRAQLDRELDAEMSAHLELAIEEHLQRGSLPPRPAARPSSASAEHNKPEKDTAKPAPCPSSTHCSRICASPFACCANPRASPPSPSSPLPSASAPTPPSSASSTRHFFAPCRSAIHNGLWCSNWSALHTPNTKVQYSYMSC